jgi:uncharacterized membrane protein
MRSLLAVVALVTFAGSCKYGVNDINGVPENPTYDHDIHPLYADHCLLCHSSPPARGAKPYFRLDVYADTNNVLGAMTMSGSALNYVKTSRMPPAAKDGDGIGPNGQAMLQKWVDHGAPQ